MERWTTCRVLGLLALCLSFDPAVSWAASPQCLQNTWIVAGQRTVTPAVVTGAPLEQLPLKGNNPAGSPVEPDRPNVGYLITGNRVDLVTTCAGFAYVRFHGPKRISTGWVEAARLKTAGPAHGTLPPEVTMLCRAAETTLNEGQQLTTPAESRLDTGDLLTRVHLGPFPNGSPTEVAHIVVNGRRMAALVVDQGGTAHSFIVYVFNDNLKSLLSPPDREDRDVENEGSDLWGFGVIEDIVIVSGQPMVRSTNAPYGKWPVYLSIIDKDGDIVPTCEIKKEPRKERVIESSADNHVCHALLAGQFVTAPMHLPVKGESLLMGKVPAQYTDKFGSMSSTASELNYHDNARAAQVSYTLLAAGIADLDNNRKSHHVGLVTFWEGDSSAGDGTYEDSQVLPVYFDANDVADLSSDANQKLAKVLPHGMKNGKLLTLDGTTYLDLSPDKQGPSSEVWKIDHSGARQVCSFKLTREVASPITK